MGDFSLSFNNKFYTNMIFTKNSQISNLERRKKTIKQVIYHINNYLDDNVSSINSKYDSLVTKIQSGIRGTSRTTSLLIAVADSKEKYPYHDSKISSSRDHLQSEVARIERKIEQLEQEIKDIRRAESRARQAYEDEMRNKVG